MKRRTRYRYQNARMKLIRRSLVGVSVLCLLVAGGLLLRYAGHTAQTNSNFEALKQEYDAREAKQAGSGAEEAAFSDMAEAPENSTWEREQDVLTQEVQFPASQSLIMPRTTVAPNAAMSPEFLSLYKKNNDLIGWLRSDAIEEIDFPIVKRDNDYYMAHDFYGRENLAGTVFLDQAGSILPRASNLVLHGHNMKNGSMFGKLSRYLDVFFLKGQPMFTFSTLYESATYVPYAVSIASIDLNSPMYAEFAHSEFASDAEMLAYTARLSELSVFDLPVDVRADDKLLTLATCHGLEDSERLILALRELRPEEDKADMAMKFKANAGKR